jgi:5-methylcytosine-specific restriction protein A
MHGRAPSGGGGRGGSPAGWRLKRLWVLKTNPLCVACAAAGVQRFAVEVDHVVPIRLGGADDYANLQGLCLEHHRAKTASERSVV